MKKVKRKRRKVANEIHHPTRASESEESDLHNSSSESCTDQSDENSECNVYLTHPAIKKKRSESLTATVVDIGSDELEASDSSQHQEADDDNESVEIAAQPDEVLQEPDLVDPPFESNNEGATHAEGEEQGGSDSDGESGESGGSGESGESDESGEDMWMSESDPETEADNSDSNDESDRQSNSSDSDEEEATSSEDEHDDEGDGIFQENQPIYDNAPISLHESLLAIFNLAIAEHLSGVLLSKILELVALHCPANSLCKRTLHTLKVYFAKLGRAVLVYHYFCSNCVFPLKTKLSVCKKCKKSGNVSFFIEMPLLQQLQTLFLRSRFLEDLQYRFNRIGDPSHIRDIYDGRIYKEQVNNGFLNNPHNISFMWWSDGLQIFKSSINASIWPLCLVVNELPYKKRILPRNIILAGLWFGKAQPNPNIFLKPLKESLDKLSSDGYNLKLPDRSVVNVKGKILCGTCDLPAKAKFMRMKQFNGASSCAKCLCAGMRYALDSKSGKKTTIQVFPYVPNATERTHAQVQDCAARAVELRQAGDKDAAVHGVKGPSLLSFMLPDIVRSMGIDIMHGAFLGVAKWLVFLLFDAKFAKCPWSLNASLDVIDCRIKNMKPPTYVERPIRSIKKASAIWKAKEYKLFLLYYSVPVFLGIMNNEYFYHHCKLVSGLSLLCQDSISLDQVNVASDLLQSYVADFARLYHLRYLGMVFHQLVHLGSVVKDLGPLWVYSCFFLESFNSVVGKLFHGTRHVALQICSSFNLVMKMPELIEMLPENSLVRKFCNSVTYKREKFKVADIIRNNVYAVGKYCDKPQVVQSSKLLLRDNYEGMMNGTVRVFYRLKKDGILYFSQEYARSLNGRKEASYISYLNNNVPSIGRVIRYLKHQSCTPECENNCECAVSYFAVVRNYSRQMWYPHDHPDIRLPHLSKIVCTNRVEVIPIDCITNSVFHIKINNDEYAAKPLNTVEVE
ncbi:Halomucin [Frankliniella fusca]|uniref:Halomucin n=1 Tax=Frankliniella fusca TaxID=407009 RepID=A0AAE1H277_9NEOP|nr:Halomucin [Frankliniella fusca]